MSAGLIPVVSAQGFNEEVTGNHGFVIPLDGTAVDYKNAILKLVSGDSKDECGLSESYS